MTWRCQYRPISLGLTFPPNYGTLVSSQSHPLWVWDARSLFWFLCLSWSYSLLC
ncbi:hypothetical protein HanIR_Chr04g0188781 [Helianthus annuus]|nr:hypothetical protein HanIR_Chr04g0188781 [Helianthus annuus]